MNLKALNRLFLLLLALLLGACAHTAGPLAQSAHPLPGDAEFYAFGVLQPKEDFANVEVAQYSLGLFKTQRNWTRLTAGRGANVLGLRYYYPVDVRWKLKDGREYILENIDMAAIMREYFKTNQLQLIHQRENRPRHPVGDSSPDLQIGVKDDMVVITWLLTLNLTPPSERVQANGARNPWKIEHEEHFVTSLKGKPASGIDFSKTAEFLK